MLVLSYRALFGFFFTHCFLDLTAVVLEFLRFPLRIVHLTEEVDQALEERCALLETGEPELPVADVEHGNTLPGR